MVICSLLWGSIQLEKEKCYDVPRTDKAYGFGGMRARARVGKERDDLEKAESLFLLVKNIDVDDVCKLLYNQELNVLLVVQLSSTIYANCAIYNMYSLNQILKLIRDNI